MRAVWAWVRSDLDFGLTAGLSLRLFIWKLFRVTTSLALAYVWFHSSFCFGLTTRRPLEADVWFRQVLVRADNETARQG